MKEVKGPAQAELGRAPSNFRRSLRVALTDAARSACFFGCFQTRHQGKVSSGALRLGGRRGPPLHRPVGR